MRAPFISPPALALAVALLAHLGLLWPTTPAPRALPTQAIAMQLRPAPLAPPAPVVAAAAEPAAAPARLPRAVSRRTAAEPVAQPATVSVEAPPAPLLRLAGASEWRYRLRQSGQDGEAVLSWQPGEGGRYSLRLTRRIGERALAAWESLGAMGPTGLAPERFALQRGGQDRQAINFDQSQARLSFSASPAQLDLPGGTQDRLSWWLQLAALLEAGPAPAPGTRWRVWVAGLRGELREWVFELQDGPGDGTPGLHLSRQLLGPEDAGVEIWLDPARGHWPVRLRQGDPERRGFELWLAEPAP